MKSLIEAIKSYLEHERTIDEVTRYIDSGSWEGTENEVRAEYLWVRQYALDDIGLASRLKALREEGKNE